MNSKTFTFIRGLTGSVVLIFVGAGAYGYIANDLPWQDFANSVGSLAGLLVGIWVKGERSE